MPRSTAQPPVLPTRALYSLIESSEILGVSARALRDLHAARAIKTVKLGRRVMIPATELERIIENGVSA